MSIEEDKREGLSDNRSRQEANGVSTSESTSKDTRPLGPSKSIAAAFGIPVPPIPTPAKPSRDIEDLVEPLDDGFDFTPSQPLDQIERDVTQASLFKSFQTITETVPDTESKADSIEVEPKLENSGITAEEMPAPSINQDVPQDPPFLPPVKAPVVEPVVEDHSSLHKLWVEDGIDASDAEDEDDSIDIEGVASHDEPEPETEPESAPIDPVPPTVHISATTTREVLEAAGAPTEPTTAERMSSTFRSASMKQRVGTAAVVAVAALGAFAGGPVWTMVLATAIITMCTIELFDALRRSGFRPATVLAIMATVAIMIGSYSRGVEALPLVTILLTLFSFLWFLCGVSKAPATINLAVTVFGFVWVGVLGAHAALLLRMPDNHGMAFLVGAVLVTIAYDTGAYIGGSVLGRHVMAPDVSPNKTWEGLVVGTVVAVAVGALGVGLIHPWNIWSGLLLGVVIAVVAPLGDLAESLVKRDLKLKDMGRILPGHGGVLDRFDAMIFVLPATYYLVTLLGLG